MSSNFVRAEIIVDGVVQGVGFRYFVYRNAIGLGLNGYVKNLYSGEVFTLVEGEKFLIEDLIEKIKIGPRSAFVKRYKVDWSEYKNEFTKFEIRH